MIVENDRDLTRIYSLYFARLGIDSIVFANPLVALDHFHQFHGRYAVVLLDWSLPGMNGVELAKRIRKYDSKVKIVLLTGYHIKDFLRDENFKGLKVSDVMSKPVYMEDLGSRIVRLCT